MEHVDPLLLGLLVAVILGGAMINGLIGMGFALVAVNVMAAALGTLLGTFGRFAFSVGFWAAVFASLLGVWQSVPYLYADFYGIVKGMSVEARQEIVKVTSTPYRLALAYITLVPIPFAFTGRPIAIIVTYTIVGSLFGAAPRPAVYIATAQAGDVEMATRIAAHRTRRGANWHTIEEPLKLAEALASAATHGHPVLVDCLTLWLSNLMLSGADLDEAADELVRTLEDFAPPVVFVSNEVGLGVVPDTPLGRSFRDAQGRLNMRMADRADRVILMTAGLPLTLKDRPAPRR